MQMLTGILALAGLAAAAPTASKGKVQSYVSKFDEVAAGLIPGVPVRTITPLGAYNGLFFDNLGVIADNVLLAGVQPFSAPNVLAYDIVAGLQGQQEIRADYDGSNTASFNFKSMYFGCLVSAQETMTSIPASCSVNVEGFRNGRKVAAKTISYVPRGTLANMEQVKFTGGFRDVDRITFKTKGLLSSALVGVLMDNMAYDVVFK